MVRLFLILTVSATCVACASTGAVPRPFPLPSGSPPPPSAKTTGVAATPERALPTEPRRPSGPAIADGYSISSTALSLRGAPYRNGGLDPAGFDCSGFVKYVFEQHGVPMPRDTRNQFSVGKEIDPSRLEPGDLVFFTTIAPGASHVGIAVGGDQFVHAPNASGVVRVENLSSQYWSTRFIGAKRVN